VKCLLKHLHETFRNVCVAISKRNDEIPLHGSMPGYLRVLNQNQFSSVCRTTSS
jgi:hypothetical protein